MRRYLITGGAGFLGTNLSKYLIDKGHKVLSVDDFSTGSKENLLHLSKNKNYEFVKHDITKPFFPEKIDGIFNLASPASPVHYQYNPIRTLKMGTLAIYNVLGIAKRLQVPILQASTSEIYGDPLQHPQKESYWGNVNPIGPRACYDEGKRVAEALFISYKKHEKINVRIARIFNTYGPYMQINDGRVVSNFITQSLSNQDITIFGDGSQTRSFCFVEDLCEGLYRLFNSNYENPVNLGNSYEYSINELASLIIELTGSSSKLVYNDLPIDDPKRRRPNISLAKDILSWSPQIELKEGLKKTINYFSEIVK